MKRLAALFVNLILVVSFLASCGGGGSSAPSAPAPIADTSVPAGEILVNVQATTGANASGALVSVEGTNISGLADANGDVRLSPLPSGKTYTLKFIKDGFTEQFKPVNIPLNTKTVMLKAQMLALEAFQTLASAQAGGNLVGKDGAKISLPASAIVDSKGQAVTGPIQISLTPVNVLTDAVGGFPGAFEGIAEGGTRSAIESYGTTYFELRQNGQKLNLAPGKTAVIELPMYVSEGVTLGDTIPLWSLNETTALWQQEGTGFVVASANSPTGFALRGTVSHFSPWNADRIQGKSGKLVVNFVVPKDFTLPELVALVASTGDSGPRWAASGNATTPSDSLSVPVNRLINLRASALLKDPSGKEIPGTSQVSVSIKPDETVSVTMTFTPANLVVRILNPSQDLSYVNGKVSKRELIDVKIDALTPFGTPTTPDRVQLLVDGVVVGDQPASITTLSTFPWDITAVADGNHVLVGRAIIKGAPVDSEPRTIVVDRVAPRMSASTPTASQALRSDTIIVIDFTETVTPFPFSLTTAVKFSVVATDATTPVEIPYSATLQGSQLTVKPLTTLPLGTASLSWSGLSDLAKNPVEGTVSLTWTTQQGFPAVVVDEAGDFGLDNMVASPDGSFYFLRNSAGPSPNLQVLRMEGNQLVQFGPSPNTLPTPEVSNYRSALAFDNNGKPIVAFFQKTCATCIAQELIVKRYEQSSNTWLALGGSLGRVWEFTRLGLAVGSDNRPVIVFSHDPTDTSRPRGWHGARFTGSSWESLGTIGRPENYGGVIHLSLDVSNRPTVITGRDSSSLFMHRHDGINWVELGVFSELPSASNLERIASSSDGQLWIAPDVRADDGTTSSVLKRYDGTQFETVAVTEDTSKYFLNRIAIINGQLYTSGFVPGSPQKTLISRLNNSTLETVTAFDVGYFETRLFPGPGNSLVFLGYKNQKLVKILIP
jgi:hypothetical protein